MDAEQYKASITTIRGVDLAEVEQELIEASVDGLITAMRGIIAKFNTPIALQAIIMVGATDDPSEDGMQMVGVPRLMLQQPEGSA